MRSTAGNLMLAGERLASLHEANYAPRRVLVEISHLLSTCGMSTRQIVAALDEAKEIAQKADHHPCWTVPTHATIAAWLKEECPEAYS